LFDIGERFRLAAWTIPFRDLLRAFINAARSDIDSTVAAFDF
jgi:hypothetical protein